MAGTVQFTLVSPERSLASVAATEVQLPALLGDMTAMAGHVPTITTLRPGVLRALASDGVHAFCVTGGFAEITGSSVSVLAEMATPVEETTGTVLDAMIEEARSLAAVALPEDRDAADKMVNDLVHMKAAAGH
jgi:F-type H+-transporting ATPase subunit epsilon